MIPPVRPVRYADVVKAIDHVIEGFTMGGRVIDLERNPNSKYAVLWRCRTEILDLRKAIADQVAINRHLQEENYRLTKELSCNQTHAKREPSSQMLITPAILPPNISSKIPVMPPSMLPQPTSLSTEDGPKKST